ncbi:low affinity immunoglobulin epsilon Fc receptor-like [Haliotis rufescens]|uniref:low affinity immunoglobulin epsilon Fc receptor-like n=1 Tax=Haliotis rufescens TaxID=6454 RepID=UPI00201EF574|nr:low affinity immunoglobulin epsilon Fc receptor-like [Haliotis rufescens]
MEVSQKPVLFMLIIVGLANICSSHQPMFESLRFEMDTFSERMKGAFEKFAEGLDYFNSKLEDINSGLNTSLDQLQDKTGEIEDKLNTGLNISHAHVKEAERLTDMRFARVEGEMHGMQKDAATVQAGISRTQETSEAIADAIGEIKHDYEDFKRRTSTLWNVQASVMSVLEQVDINKEELSTKITNVSKDLTVVVKYAVRPLHTAMLNVVEEIAILKEKLNSIGIQNDCPLHWKRFRNSCFLHVTEPSSWKIAKFMCKEMNAFLVEIYSQEEAEFVSNIPGNDTSEIWTGAKIGRKGTWFWEGSKSEVSFDVFGGRHLSGRGRKYCGFLLPETRSLDDKNCGRELGYICRMFKIKN